MTAAAPVAAPPFEAPKLRIARLAPWFGANTARAESVGRELGKLAWCGVPFCGGAPELPHIDTRGGVAADLHCHIVNLARVVSDPDLYLALRAQLDGILFHPVELSAAQQRCAAREMNRLSGLFEGAQKSGPSVQWAVDYFITCWMGRGGHAGTRTEFTQNLSVRWTSGGGDSAVRFRSAIDCLEPWNKALRRWSFVVEDCFSFLDRVRDEPGHGLYIDAPWPDVGHEYKHAFAPQQQIRLAAKLRSFTKARIVIRYGDHPLIPQLYPPTAWTWLDQTSRNQQNNEVSEVLILNGPSYAEVPA